MLVLAPFVLLVAAVAALGNPHRKAAAFKQPTRGLRKREVSAVRTKHQYLNKKTESKCGTLSEVVSESVYLQLTSARIRREWNSLSTGPF